MTPMPRTALPTGSRIDRRIAALALGTAVLILAGCDRTGTSPQTAAAPEVRPSELTDAGGRPCPKTLPLGDDPSGHGFGTEEVADELPTLLEPQEAWVCQYNPGDAGTPSGGGTIYRWQRAGRPGVVDEAELTDLKDALDDLAPADAEGPCTSDLGPRWLVVYSHDGDLTGVVVDDYGCRDVRLTDNPHTTPPGADDQEGTVGGVLAGGGAVLEALGVGRTG